jgi:mannose-6-phosphate isomerase
MWIGAHPSAPSRIDDANGPALSDLIAAEPARTLGAQTRTRFGDRLPFLMKLLAAREPLSLQVHPGAERAGRRFAEQVAAGIPLHARERTYPDPSHKPELLYALTRFEGMAGFRDARKSAAILRGLRLPWLDQVADRLDGGDASRALRDVVTTWLSLPADDVGGKLADVRAAALAAETRAHSAPRMRRPAVLDPGDVARESIRVYSATVPLIDRYPSDSGVLVTLLLNHLVLAPGESLFIDAGVVHAYTSGFGVEVMAASDNVLRAGLTPKHVDIPELLEVADFRPISPPCWTPSPSPNGTRLTPPVDDFELLVLDPHGDCVRLDRETPRLVLCLRDKVELEAGGTHMALEKGQAAFVEAGSPLAVSGHGQASIAQTPHVAGPR